MSSEKDYQLNDIETSIKIIIENYYDLSDKETITYDEVMSGPVGLWAGVGCVTEKEIKEKFKSAYMKLLSVNGQGTTLVENKNSCTPLCFKLRLRYAIHLAKYVEAVASDGFVDASKAKDFNSGHRLIFNRSTTGKEEEVMSKLGSTYGHVGLLLQRSNNAEPADVLELQRYNKEGPPEVRIRTVSDANRRGSEMNIDTKIIQDLHIRKGVYIISAFYRFSRIGQNLSNIV